MVYLLRRRGQTSTVALASGRHPLGGREFAALPSCRSSAAECLAAQDRLSPTTEHHGPVRRSTAAGHPVAAYTCPAVTAPEIPRLAGWARMAICRRTDCPAPCTAGRAADGSAADWCRPGSTAAPWTEACPRTAWRSRRDLAWAAPDQVAGRWGAAGIPAAVAAGDYTGLSCCRLA